jgi:hypothetical protein
MLVEQLSWNLAKGWTPLKKASFKNPPQLVLAFGGRSVIPDPQRYLELRMQYPDSNIMCCSTAGEIIGTKVVDDSIISTAICFEKTSIRISKISVAGIENDFQAGKVLVEKLQGEDLCHIFAISDGQQVNGTELVAGMNEFFNGKVPITGGLAGDGPYFEKTFVGMNEAPAQGNIVAIGFYGKHLKVGHGSKGGWDPFGPVRVVTRSAQNVLFDLDNQSALQLYKKYLGPLSAELPGSALQFPLCIQVPGQEEVIVRTILSIDEEKQSMVFAGNLPEGASVQLMRANFDRLVDGATVAAECSLSALGSFEPELAILVSCVGRRLVLNDRIEEEIEEVKKVLGVNTAITGFYSYGEISPLLNSAKCELHNQTMTITTYSEV